MSPETRKLIETAEDDVQRITVKMASLPIYAPTGGGRGHVEAARLRLIAEEMRGVARTLRKAAKQIDEKESKAC
jgi:hypothetical protein